MKNLTASAKRFCNKLFSRKPKKQKSDAHLYLRNRKNETLAKLSIFSLGFNRYKASGFATMTGVIFSYSIVTKDGYKFSQDLSDTDCEMVFQTDSLLAGDRVEFYDLTFYRFGVLVNLEQIGNET